MTGGWGQWGYILYKWDTRGLPWSGSAIMYSQNFLGSYSPLNDLPSTHKCSSGGEIFDLFMGLKT